MKKIIFTLTLFFCFTGISYAMDSQRDNEFIYNYMSRLTREGWTLEDVQTIQLPSAPELQNRLKKYNHIISSTNILQQLLTDEKKHPIIVIAAVNETLRLYNLISPNEIGLDYIPIKEDMVRIILQDHPQSLNLLEKNGYFKQIHGPVQTLAIQKSVDQSFDLEKGRPHKESCCQKMATIIKKLIFRKLE